MKAFASTLAVLGSLTALSAQTPCPTSTNIHIDRGTYSARPGVSFQLRNFDATLVPIASTSPGCFQKTTVVHHADIQVSNASLTAVFGEKLGKSNSKIKDFAVENSEGTVALTGTIVKLVPIHFRIEGPASTDGIVIKMQAKRILADGIPVKSLLALFGEQLGNLLGVDNVPGMKVENDILSFAPEQVAHLRGHIQAVVSSSQGLLLRYGTPHRTRSHARSAGSDH